MSNGAKKVLALTAMAMLLPIEIVSVVVRKMAGASERYSAKLIKQLSEYIG